MTPTDNNWRYLPIEKKVRTRVHRRTGQVQKQTIGSGIRGWRNVKREPTQ